MERERFLNMQAVIIVSGAGVPQESEVLGGIEYMPMLVHQIQILRSMRVTDIILALNSMSEVFNRGVDELERRFQVTIFRKVERFIYGNGAWLALMKRDGLLGKKPFFLLQSDVISEYPFKAMRQTHDRYRSEATMAVFPVQDPSNYDVVSVDDITGMVQECAFFPHHPRGPRPGDLATAHAYIFNPSVLLLLDLIIAQPPFLMTVERGILPHLVSRRRLYAVEILGDLPCINLKKRSFLDGLSSHVSQGVHFPRPSVRGRVHIHPSALILDQCYIGPNVVIGPNCRVERGARLTKCILMRGVKVGAGAVVDRSIILSGSNVGRGAVIIDMSVVGRFVEVAERVCLSGAVIIGWDGRVPRSVVNDICHVELDHNN